MKQVIYFFALAAMLVLFFQGKAKARSISASFDQCVSISDILPGVIELDEDSDDFVLRGKVMFPTGNLSIPDFLVETSLTQRIRVNRYSDPLARYLLMRTFRI
jgi:hypothetical protein